MINKQFAKAALCNLFVGDALSMPVHWYYNPGDIIRQFGAMGVQTMQPAPEHHPSSIMVLHSTKAGGRRAVEKRGATKDVVGDVILKGKKALWGKTGTHYHHGMPAGENTLNAWWARELMQYLLDEDGYSIDTWLSRYIDFMTAEPARHPDTYAESCHRGFFANWAAGVNPKECGAVTHDTPSMGALVTLAPLVIALNRDNDLKMTKSICRQHIWLTHPDDKLMIVVDAYVELLLGLLAAASGDSASYDAATRDRASGDSASSDENSVLALLQTAMNATGTVNLSKLVMQKRGDAAVVGGQYSLACYISDSWPSVCYLAAKYYDNPAKALLINTNLGGENAHRGAVLGTLVGAASGEYPVELYSQLAHDSELNQLIKEFSERFIP